jgi:D-alanyl-D-alanine carboxypeptidase
MKKITDYGSALGPHRESALDEQHSLIKMIGKELQRFFSHVHTVPSLILLFALLSFSTNLAFTYIAFQKQSFAPDFNLLNKVGFGSDDGVSSEKITLPTTSHFSVIANAPALKVTAKSFLVADAETGEIILESSTTTSPYPIASVTKLMTSVVTKEHSDLQDQGTLSTGEKVQISDLLYPLLMESSNDAAEVIATDYGRDNFITLLNQKAAALGMTSTHFEDPSGLSPLNVSSTVDLLRLALYLESTHPELLDITRVTNYSIQDHQWKNLNTMLTYPNFLGGKNGFIPESKETTLSYFSFFFRGISTDSTAVSRPVVVILLQSDNRDADTSELLSYISRNIRYDAPTKK